MRCKYYLEMTMLTIKYGIMQGYNYLELGAVNCQLAWTRLKIDWYLLFR